MPPRGLQCISAGEEGKVSKRGCSHPELQDVVATAEGRKGIRQGRALGSRDVRWDLPGLLQLLEKGHKGGNRGLIELLLLGICGGVRCWVGAKRVSAEDGEERLCLLPELEEGLRGVGKRVQQVISDLVARGGVVDVLPGAGRSLSHAELGLNEGGEGRGRRGAQVGGQGGLEERHRGDCIECM